MDGSTHFSDLTNLSTSPRNSVRGDHSGTELQQHAHSDLAQHGRIVLGPYDANPHNNLVKQSSNDLAAMNGLRNDSGAMHSDSTPRQSLQMVQDTEPLISEPPPAAPESAGLAHAFGIDMGHNTSNVQGTGNPLDSHEYLCSSALNADSQSMVQDSAIDRNMQQAQMLHDQTHRMQANMQLSATSDQARTKSYPCSPPSRPLMTPQSEQRPSGKPMLSHRPSQSLGQAGAFMSSMHSRDMFSQNHTSAPVSPSEGMQSGPFGALYAFSSYRPEMGFNMPDHSILFDQTPQLGARDSTNFGTSCAPSARSTSPSVSMASTSMTSASPLGSGKYNADGSFTSQTSHETSFDSLSNHANGVYSCASSTADESLNHGSFGLAASQHRIKLDARPEMKPKVKLRNLERKAICDYHVANPSVKQDAIATKFGVERSTVSKILKNKEKWLAIDPQSDEAHIAKHRAVKFPEVEKHLSSWIAELKAQAEPIRDSIIRNKALEIARKIGLGEDTFKASGGWIDKFRERHQIPKPASLDSAGKSRESSVKTGVLSLSPGMDNGMRVAPQPLMLMGDTPGRNQEVADQSHSGRRRSARINEGKGTPQKRGREAEQAALTVSPLSHDMANMHFHTPGGGAQLGDQAMLRHTLFHSQPGPTQPMPVPNFMFDAQGLPEPAFNTEEEAHSDRKRRRAIPEQEQNYDAMALGPAIDLRFPSSESSLNSQISHVVEQASISPQENSPRARRTVANLAAGSSSCGRGRRGQGRGSNANHTPQTPSPLSMSPADIKGEQNLGGSSAAHAEQVRPPTMERQPAVEGSGDQNSNVTAEEAQQCLKVVLKFLNEQRRDFVQPNHYVVLGHLQANIQQKIKDQTGEEVITESLSSEAPPETMVFGEGVAAPPCEQ